MTNARVNNTLISIEAPGYIKSFRGIQWAEFRAFFEELFRGTESESRVLRDLDSGSLERAYNGVRIADVLEVCTFEDVKMSPRALRNLGRYLHMMEVGGSDSLYWKTGLLIKVRAAVSRMPEVYLSELDMATGANASWIHHLASVGEMREGLPYEFIVAVGDRTTASCVAMLFDLGISAEYVSAFRQHRWEKNTRVLTMDDARMLHTAFSNDVGAEYLGAALKLGAKFPEILRMSAEGISFEYLAAYYERETV